jgi:antitoxin ParD1/3/4
MNISLPPLMKEWVEVQVSAGGYGTASEFFRQLVRAEQERQLREKIDGNLYAAINSGESTPMTPADWDQIRRQGRKRIAGKRKAK